MALKARVESLDEVPEAFRGEYEERGGAFVLSVENPDALPGVQGLRSAYEKVTRERDRYKETASLFGDRTPEEIAEIEEEVERLRDSKGGEPSKEQVEEIEKRVAKKYEKEYAPKIERAEKMEALMKRKEIDISIDRALDSAGFPAKHKPLLRAFLKEKGPKVVETGDGFAGVFSEDVNGIPGDHEIGEFVADWAKTDEALPYLPARGEGGSGSNPEGGGAPGRGGKGTISRNDPLAFAKHAEDIASGKVEVTD